MTTETIVMDVQLNTAKANAQLDDFRGHADHAAQSLDNTLHSVHEGIGSRKITRGLASLQFALGGAGAEAGHLLHGLGAVSTALTLGPEAILAAGFAFGIVKLAEAFTEARENAETFSQSIAASVETLESRHNVAVAAATKTIEDLETAYKNFGKTAGLIVTEGLMERLDHANEAIPKLEEAVEAQEKKLRKTMIAAGQNLTSAETEAIEDQKGHLEVLEERLKIVKGEAASLPAAIDRASSIAIRTQEQLEESKKPKKTVGHESEKFTKEGFALARFGLDPASLVTIEDELAKQDQLVEDSNARNLVTASNEVDARLKFDQMKVDSAKTANAMITELNLEAGKKQLAMTEQIGQSYKDLYGSVLQGSVSTGIGTLEQFFEASAAGQEDASQQALASFLKGMGGQLVGLGTKAIFEGSSYLIASAGLDPRGYGLIGLGGAAIAAGIGMGAAGSGVTAQIDATAQRNKDLADASSSRETATRGSGGGAKGGGGGFTVENTFVYAAAGPHPEDQGRAVDEAMRSYDRRRGRGGRSGLGR